jgi:hypothetical protein
MLRAMPGRTQMACKSTTTPPLGLFSRAHPTPRLIARERAFESCRIENQLILRFNLGAVLLIAIPSNRPTQAHCVFTFGYAHV